MVSKMKFSVAPTHWYEMGPEIFAFLMFLGYVDSF